MLIVLKPAHYTWNPYCPAQRMKLKASCYVSLCRDKTLFGAGDTVPLQTFVNFANGSDVVLHETVGPVHTLQGIPVANRNIYLVGLQAIQAMSDSS